MAEDHGPFTNVRCTIYDLFGYFFEGDGVMGLLDGIDRVALLLQVMHGIEGFLVIGPIDGFFGTESGLMDLLIRRTATDTAEHDPFDTHGIGGAEDSAYVMLAADVIEDDHQRQFFCLLVLLDVHTSHLGCG